MNKLFHIYWVDENNVKQWWYGGNYSAIVSSCSKREALKFIDKLWEEEQRERWEGFSPIYKIIGYIRQHTYYKSKEDYRKIACVEIGKTLIPSLNQFQNFSCNKG